MQMRGQVCCPLIAAYGHLLLLPLRLRLLRPLTFAREFIMKSTGRCRRRRRRRRYIDERKLARRHLFASFVMALN